MNLDEVRNLTRIIPAYMQPTDLFRDRDVVDYCEYRERQIAERISGISHTTYGDLTLHRELAYAHNVPSSSSGRLWESCAKYHSCSPN